MLWMACLILLIFLLPLCSPRRAVTQKKLWVCLSFSVVHHFICFLMAPHNKPTKHTTKGVSISAYFMAAATRIKEYCQTSCGNHDSADHPWEEKSRNDLHLRFPISQPWSRASATGSKQGLISLCEREKFLSYAFLCLFGRASTLDSLWDKWFYA